MTCVSILNGLADDDTLRSVLVWTAASDHKHLRQTCRRFRDICDSQMFLQQRCEQGLAEVKVPMTLRYTGEVPEYLREDDDESESSSDSNSDSDDELKSNEFGFVDFKVIYSDAKVYVDKKEAGMIKMQFIPFFHEDSFHAHCDSVSNEAEMLATTFFTAGGQPDRVPSVKKAYNESLSSGLYSNHPIYYLLYISKFELKEAYQCKKGGPTIGATALKRLLTNDVLLDKWCLAMYIPEGPPSNSSSMELEGEALRSRTQTDMIADMRKFLQAGFVQVKETVNSTDCLQVFCTPAFINKKDILTEDEAFAIPVKTKMVPSKQQQSKEAKDLLSFFVEKCSSAQEYRERLKNWNQMSWSNIEALGQALEGNEETFNEETFREHRQNAILGIESEILDLNVEIKDRLSELLAAHIGTKNFSKIVTESFAFHTCSFNLEPDFIEILIGCVPESERKVALNLVDQIGCTPLMLAVKADSKHKRNKQLHTCRILLNHGADRDFRDVDGRTALGTFRCTTRDAKDFSEMNRFAARFDDYDENHVREMESLLMPSGGATGADKISI